MTMERIIQIASDVLIISGFIFMMFGVIGIFKFKNFYSRMLVASKVDTVGFITLILGMVLRHGVSFFSAKLIVIMLIIIIINPLEAYILSRSAHMRGLPFEDEK